MLRGWHPVGRYTGTDASSSEGGALQDLFHARAACEAILGVGTLLQIRLEITLPRASWRPGEATRAPRFGSEGAWR